MQYLRSFQGNYLKSLLTCFSIIFLIFTSVHSAFAIPGINETISFQSKIVNTDGTNSSAICGVSCDFRFRLFDASVGGVMLWEEFQAGIPMNDGIVSVDLGANTAFGTSVDWNDDSLYLEVSMNANGVGGDGPDSDGYEEVFDNPRIRFDAVPYAMNAKQLSGLVAGDFVQIAPGVVQTTGNTTNTIININEDGSGTPELLDLSVGGTPRFNIDNNGATTNTMLNTSDIFNILTGSLKVGNGTPNLALDGEDLYVEGSLEVDGITDFGGIVDFNLNQAREFRLENAIAAPVCDINALGREYYDTGNDAAYVCIESSPATYTWFDFTATAATTSSKVVTVGTGGNYSTISGAASYLGSLTGGIILLTPEIHAVTTSVDLEGITIIGANTSDTIIDISGNGLLRVKETQFKSVTLDVDSGLVSVSGLDAKYDVATTSSIIFEWVDFIIGGAKVLIDSSDATSPIVNTRFISIASTSGNQQMFLDKATSNLDASSTHFVESQGGAGPIDLVDWDVEIAGSSNVKTDGLISTIPDDTIYVYPGMNIQGAIDSLPNGGFITLLPGIHQLTSTLLIDNNSIQITGYGDASIISATGFVGGQTIAAIQIGAADGSAPVDDVVLNDFKLEVTGTGGTDIHGIRVVGGADNQIRNVTIEKISGVSGNGELGARMGILMLDSSGGNLIRPVVQDSRIFGDSGSGAYFTDGIHVTADGSIDGVYGFGNRVINALIQGNNIDYVRETAAVFVGVDDSSLFNNRFARMGAGGGGAYGLYMGNINRVNMTANLVSGSLSTTSIAIGVESFDVGVLKQTVDSIFVNNVIDGTANGGIGFGTGFQIGAVTNTEVARNLFQLNSVLGASNATTVAFDIRGNADNNSFSNNIVSSGTDPWDVGFNVDNISAEANLIRGNKLNNVTTGLIDNGSATQLGVPQHRDSVAPTVNDDADDGYSVGTLWMDIISENVYVLLENSSGAAVWEQINGIDPLVAAGFLSATSSDVFEGGDSNQLIIESDLSASDRATSLLNILQQNDVANIMSSDLFEILQQDVDSTGGALYIQNYGGGDSFRIDDEAGDTTPLVVDDEGNLGVGTSAPIAKLEVSNGAGVNDILGLYDDSTEVFAIRDGGDVDFNLNEAVDFRIENIDGSVTLPICDVNGIGRQYYDTSDDNVYACIETAPVTYNWVALNTSAASSSKVVTVGTGGEYGTIAAAASYLNGLTGGIMILTPEVHAITTIVDLERILVIGSSVTDSIIEFTGGGQFLIKNTHLKSLHLRVDSGISSAFALDIKNGATSSSLLSEYVATEVGGIKYLIGSSSATAPVFHAKLSSTYAPTGSANIVDKISTANLDVSSTFVVQNQCCNGSLNFVDWPLTVSGAVNVYTTGIISSAPDKKLVAYPGMNLQGLINSLPAGGKIELLPGVHTITEPLIIDNDGIEIVGDGHSTIIRASGFVGITETTAAIHIGLPDGSAPITGVRLGNFAVEVDTNNIHGIRAAGGSDIKVQGISITKISGASGVGANTKVGILFTDAVASGLNGIILTDNYVMGSPGNYFTDGIHYTGGTSYGIAGIWSYGNTSTNALIKNNSIHYVGQNGILTIADQVYVVENNIGQMGANGGVGYGIFAGNGYGLNIRENLIEEPVSILSIGIGLDSYVKGIVTEISASSISSNILAGTHIAGVGFEKGIEIGANSNTKFDDSLVLDNIIKGPAIASTIALNIVGESDNVSYSNNMIDGNSNGWDDGIVIHLATSDNNLVRGTKFFNVTNTFSDAGVGTILGVSQHRNISNPTIVDDSSAGFSVGTIWINTNTDEAFISTDSAIGAAVWKQMDAAALSSSPGAYGEMSVNANTVAQTTSAAWAPITAYDTVGEFFNTTVDAVNDQITVTQDGVYLVNVSMSFSGANSATYELGVAINGTVQNDIVSSRKLGTGGDVGSATITGILDLSAGDVIDVRIKGTSTSATIQYSNVVLFTSNAAASSGASDLDGVYDGDTDKVLNVSDALGLEFRETAGGDISFDLQSTGSLIVQDNDVTFLEITENGSFNYTLDITDNPSYTITNLGSGEFRINDESGDTTPFLIDQNGNVVMGGEIANAKLDITSNDVNAIRINPYGAASGNTGGFQFMELAANGTNYVGFQAPDSIATDILWTLPNNLGDVGEVLYTDGSGNLDWKLINSLADADTDTKITVEGLPDEDMIRFDTAGFERMAIDNNGDVSIGIATVAVVSEGFEVSVPPVGSTTGGDLNWSQDLVDFNEGVASAVSDGALLDSQSAWIDFDYTLAQDGKIVFDWKVDSEINYDFLIFCLDNDVTCTVAAAGPVDAETSISGSTSWASVEIPVTAGLHSFRWLYGKDASLGAGTNQGWIDNIVIYEGSSSGTGNLFVAGSIGIGTDAPTKELDVVGNARISGLANCDIIYTDASGNLNCGTDQGAIYDVYDNAGGQTFTTTPITMNLDTERRANANYTLATDEVTINSDGTYEVSFDCSLDGTTTARSNGRCWLEEDTGTGFAIVDGSECYTYNRTTVNAEDSCSRTVVLDLVSTNSIRVNAVRHAGNTTLATIADGSSLTIRKIIAPGADLAEIYYTNDSDVEAGKVVSIDGGLYAGVKLSHGEYDGSAMGVISTNPGQTIGMEDGDHEGRPVIVALAGRVPVNIDSNSENIKAGDYLTSGSIDGTAMRANKPGIVIGKALEDWDSEGEKNTIMIYVGTASYDPNDGVLHQSLSPVASAEYNAETDSYEGGISLGGSDNFFNSIYTASSFAKSTSIGNNNVSENYLADSLNVVAGDVVMPTFSDSLRITKATQYKDSNVMGVVATSPGVTLSGWDENSSEFIRPVALAGRVPVKVSTENGPIREGDRLIPASTPGYAMNACGPILCEPGMSIGIALESFSENQSGDTNQVANELVAVKQQVEEEISQIVDTLETQESIAASGQDTEVLGEIEEQIEQISDIDNLVEELTKPMSDEQGKGRVMMFINLTYHGAYGGFEVVDEIEKEMEVVIEDVLHTQSQDIDDLNIDGELLQGDILGSITSQELTVLDSVKITGTLKVAGHISLGKDSAGQAIVLEGDEQVVIRFEEQYISQPLVFVQALTNKVRYSVADININGFVINLVFDADEEQIFNWMVISSDGNFSSLSNGSEGSILTVEDWENTDLDSVVEEETIFKQAEQVEDILSIPEVEEELIVDPLLETENLTEVKEEFAEEEVINIPAEILVEDTLVDKVVEAGSENILLDTSIVVE